MLIIVAYDIETKTAAGKNRLLKVAKECLKWGARIQDSVFECELNASQFREFYSKLAELIDAETDSVRFYSLGNRYKEHIFLIGSDPSPFTSGFVL